MTEMSTRTMDSNSLLIPTWPSFEKDVFDITQPISNGSKNDMGSLKGAIIARGSVNVKASDVPVKPDESDYDLTTSEGQAHTMQLMPHIRKSRIITIHTLNRLYFKCDGRAG